MPRARALSVSRDPISRSAPRSRHHLTRVCLCAASRLLETSSGLSRIDRRFKPGPGARFFSLSSPRASDRYLLIAALPGERPAAESRRVCFLCQRPRIIDTSQFASRKKEKRKKKRTKERKREKSFCRSTSRKRRSYNRRGPSRPYIPASRIVSLRQPHARCVAAVVYAYTHVHVR